MSARQITGPSSGSSRHRDFDAAFAAVADARAALVRARYMACKAGAGDVFIGAIDDALAQVEYLQREFR
jgi:hypothetical protein